MPKAQTARLRRPSPGRPRRSSDQEAEVRGRVTEIAALLFREEGFDALTMRRIAREAGVSVMSLYDYFRSKNEIIRSIWERFFSRCFARVDGAVAECGGKPRQRLEAACAAYTAYWLGHPDEYRAVFMIEDRVESQEKYYVEASNILERYAIFGRLLAELPGISGGDSEGPRARSVALICALNGICHMLVTVSEHGWPPPAQLLEQVLRMVDGPM